MNTVATVGVYQSSSQYTLRVSLDVLTNREVPKPAPKAGEVLIKAHATTVSRTDRGMLRADPFIVRFFFGLCRPKRTILGVDFAGEVEAVGAGVISFKLGQRVFGIGRHRRPKMHLALRQYKSRQRCESRCLHR